ncbi:C6 transcription factor [Achaetomium macrosporum]|uniref:C6 transcription factor n=1 Tax=Achaetomium macrosporum TaxID=79813 RepID=A0AAN7C5Q5_9PEZI|nr:C6 transcription factor [Achaetomium macrosporum]
MSFEELNVRSHSSDMAGRWPHARARSVVAGEQRQGLRVHERGDNRGSAPKSYVALLQARIKLLDQVLWIHSIDVDSSIAQLDAQRTEVDAGPSGAAYSSSLAFNQMCAELEGALYVDEPLCELEQSAGEARFSGVTNTAPSPSTDYQSPAATRYYTRFSERETSTEASGVDDLGTPGLKRRLIGLYFEWEQPWYHMVDEKPFRQSMQCNGPYSSPLLVCCILAVGSRYSDEAETRTDPDDPNTAGRAFAERADVPLRREIKIPSITMIQALGVLGLYHVGVGSDSLGWLYHGMANRMLLDMGLNVDSTAVTGTGPFTADVRLRRQIYWALYCNDKLWASYTGRVCTMLVSCESLHFDSRAQTLPRLRRAMVTHCQILEKILMNLGWSYSLRKELKVKTAGGPNGPTPSPHACILNMVYHTSIVLLAKPFFRSGNPVRSRRSEQDDDIFRRASTACREAAGEICLPADRYRELFGSFRRSPLTATHCTLTAALVLMFAQTGTEVGSPGGNRAQLDGCMQTLRKLSVSWGPSSALVTRKRIVQLEMLPLAPDQPGSQPPHVGSVGEAPCVVDAPDIPVTSSSHQFWDDAATTQLFAEVGHLNVGAFDALSWDYANQDALDFHF